MYQTLELGLGNAPNKHQVSVALAVEIDHTHQYGPESSTWIKLHAINRLFQPSFLETRPPDAGHDRMDRGFGFIYISSPEASII
jgi:hypothetical protein